MILTNFVKNWTTNAYKQKLCLWILNIFKRATFVELYVKFSRLGYKNVVFCKFLNIK